MVSYIEPRYYDSHKHILWHDIIPVRPVISFLGGAFDTGITSEGRAADLNLDFRNENFLLNHTGLGCVSMADVGGICQLQNDKWYDHTHTLDKLI